MFHTTLLFLNIGSSEMILILGVALLLFGGEKLPELARGLGKGIRDFKEASEDVKREINNQINSFEDKRTEDKLISQPLLPEAPVVPNTIPVAGTTYTGTEAPHVTEAQSANLEGEPHATNDAVATGDQPLIEEHHQVAELTPEANYHAGNQSNAEQRADRNL